MTIGAIKMRRHRAKRTAARAEVSALADAPASAVLVGARWRATRRALRNLQARRMAAHFLQESGDNTRLFTLCCLVSLMFSSKKGIAARLYRRTHRKHVAFSKLKYNQTQRGKHTKLKESLHREQCDLKDPLWSENFYSELIRDGECHYCKQRLGKQGHSLDRMDSSVGHVCWNVVPCCGRCNRIKSNLLTYEEMMRLAPVLRANVVFNILKIGGRVPLQQFLGVKQYE